MFPKLLERSLEATNFQILAAIVGPFNKDCLSKNWSKFFQHTRNDGPIAGIGFPRKTHNKKENSENGAVLCLQKYMHLRRS